jgi:UDP-GlcNAc:undecaprenyl-phosphate GlcNAc-1-phosphate transferase
VPIDLLGMFLGPVAVGAAFTLRERAMLGDIGSNFVGALAGISLVVVLGPTGRALALGVVVALTIFGEFRSISAAIDRVPLLRSLDSLGRTE